MLASISLEGMQNNFKESSLEQAREAFYGSRSIFAACNRLSDRVTRALFMEVKWRSGIPTRWEQESEKIRKSFFLDKPSAMV